MGLKITMDPIVANLEAVGRDATDAAYNELVKGAKEMRDLAREMAPVDHGDLEAAIVESHSKGDKAVAVGIDLNAVDEHGTQVAEYGLMQHEGLAPYGSGFYHLGPKSTAKDAGRGIVGGKFIERAVDALKKRVLQSAVFAVKRIYRAS